MAIQSWGSRVSAAALALALASCVSLQPSEGFSASRSGRLCQTTVGSNVYFPASTVDARDLEKFAELQQLTDPGADPFQVDMAEFTKLLNQFRDRSDAKCAEAFFPLSGAESNKRSTAGGKSSGSVRRALDECMCRRTRDWLLQAVARIYECDWPAGSQAELWRLAQRKATRFNRFVRFQLAINGDVEAVETYDALVDKCLRAYVAEQISKAGASVESSVNGGASEKKPVASTPSPSPSPATPKTPRTAAREPQVESPGRGSKAKNECEATRAACVANAQLASELGALAQRMSVLSLSVILLAAVVVAVAEGVAVAVCARVWRQHGRSEEYQPLVPVAPFLSFSK